MKKPKTLKGKLLLGFVGFLGYAFCTIVLTFIIVFFMSARIDDSPIQYMGIDHPWYFYDTFGIVFTHASIITGFTASMFLAERKVLKLIFLISATLTCIALSTYINFYVDYWMTSLK